MYRFLLKRIALAVITLVLLSAIVFAASSSCPGTWGGTFSAIASQHDVDLFNHAHGVDRPIPVQYWDWISHFVRGDFGQSLQYQRLGQPAHRAVACQFAEARGARVSPGRADQHPRRCCRSPPSRAAHRPGNHDRRSLPHVDSRVRDCDRADRRLRPRARMVARAALPRRPVPASLRRCSTSCCRASRS